MPSLLYGRCKFLAKKRTLLFAFVDLEKAFDRVPREVVGWALRKLGVEEWLVKAVMTMYEKASTMVETKHRNSEEFEVKIGVHQGLVGVRQGLVLSLFCLLVFNIYYYIYSQTPIKRTPLGPRLGVRLIGVSA